MSRPFLSANWQNLIMVNYEVDPAVLLPYLPSHTEIDLFHGKAYVSVVGFMFANTRVLGFSIPFHVNFEEVNLRFYVRHFHEGGWRRGVVFIKEIVPRPAITIVANTLYREHYCTMPMKHSLALNGDILSVSYAWKFKRCWHSLTADVLAAAIPMLVGSEEEFIAEHCWGYAKYSKVVTIEYAVAHPRWEVYPVKSYQLDCEFELLYGMSFSYLANQTPTSVFVAKGSAVTVSDKRVISFQ